MTAPLTFLERLATGEWGDATERAMARAIVELQQEVAALKQRVAALERWGANGTSEERG